MKQSELEHHKKISAQAEAIWGWGTPAGKARAQRRAGLINLAGHLKPGHRVLEIGCGTGIFSVQFAQTGIQLVSIDICQDLLDQAKQKINTVDFKIDDAENLSFPDAHFDAVIASSVLHHLDVPRTLQGILRVLKKGGRLALAEPNMMNPQIMVQKNVPWIKRAMGDSEEETAFFRWSIAHQLRKSGFVDVEVTPFDFLHPLVPPASIPLVDKIGRVMEHLPLVKEIAGSLLIGARKPEA